MGGSVSVAGCRRRGRGFRTGQMARSAIAICRTVTCGRVRLGIDAGAVRTRLGCIQTLARTVVAALNESVDACARFSGFRPVWKKISVYELPYMEGAMCDCLLASGRAPVTPAVV